MSGSPCRQAPHRPASRVPTAPENERPAALFLEFPFQSRWPRPPGFCFSGALQSWGARRAEAGGDGAHGEGLFRNAGPSALLKPCQCLLEDHGVLHTLAWSLLLAPLLPEASLPLLRRGGGGVGVQEEEATPLQPQQARAGQACRPLSRARPRMQPCGPLPPSASLVEAWTILRLGLQKLLSPSAHVPRLHFLCLQNEINTSRL